MVDFTRPATWDDVFTLARWLDEQGARWALIGGYAIAAHGLVRMSEDVDLLVDPAPANVPRWAAALARLPDGAAAELVADEHLFDRDGHYAVRINDVITVDVMPAACGHSWEELAPYIERKVVDGVALPVLGIDGLLLTKEGLRDRDRADRAALLRARAALRGE